MSHTSVTRQPGPHHYSQDELAQILDSHTSAGEDTGVVVYTSGSTGSHKAVAVSAGALAASGRSTARFLGGHGQWLLTLPTHHIAGIQVLARSVLAGQAVVEMDLSQGFTTANFLAAYDRMSAPARFTSLVPTQLHRLLTPGPLLAQAVAALSGFTAVLLGGAAAPHSLLAQAREAGIRVVTTYGMSETAGGCVYESVPLDIASVRTLDPLSPSRILISGPMLASGYLIDGRISHPESNFEVDSDGTLWHVTNDLGVIDPSGRLNVLGRADDVIISGGENISPSQVEDVLTGQLGISQVCVVGVPDPVWGHRVVAVVIPDCALSEIGSLTQVRDLVGDNLGRSASPTELIAVTSFPLTQSGKVDRQAVSRLALNAQ